MWVCMFLSCDIKTTQVQFTATLKTKIKPIMLMCLSLHMDIIMCSVDSTEWEGERDPAKVKAIWDEVKGVRERMIMIESEWERGNERVRGRVSKMMGWEEKGMRVSGIERYGEGEELLVKWYRIQENTREQIWGKDVSYREYFLLCHCQGIISTQPI